MLLFFLMQWPMEQKLTAISPSSSLVAVGTTDNRVSLLHLSSLEPATETLKVDDELVDIDWGGPTGELVRLPLILYDSLMVLAGCHDHQFPHPLPRQDWRESFSRAEADNLFAKLGYHACRVSCC